MMTPQEVASHSFAKATLGGYNLAQVDEFLDALTEDYAALYNENAILKNKLKVLSDTVEEYRATDNAMRKTLLAAQKMADDMVEDAKKKQAKLMGQAEQDAHKRVEELKKAVEAEEFRLKRPRNPLLPMCASLRRPMTRRWLSCPTWANWSPRSSWPPPRAATPRRTLRPP